MAKRPVAGAVKRRLARDIGTTAATRFYRTALAHTLLRLSHDKRWRTYLAVSPDAALAEASWPSPPRVAHIAQGHGDLGARMQALFDRLPPGPVVVIGSDIPAVRPIHIAQAFKLLGRADAVFGPAKDGGYWLVGKKKSPRRLAPFRGVPWSTERALAATVANLSGQSVAFAPTLADVDTGEDYARQRHNAERFLPCPQSPTTCSKRLQHPRAANSPSSFCSR